MCEQKRAESVAHLLTSVKIEHLMLRGFNLLVEGLCKASRTQGVSEKGALHCISVLV